MADCFLLHRRVFYCAALLPTSDLHRASRVGRRTPGDVQQTRGGPHSRWSSRSDPASVTRLPAPHVQRIRYLSGLRLLYQLQWLHRDQRARRFVHA